MMRAMVLLLWLWPQLAAAASPVPTELYAEVDHGLRPATVLADPEGYHGRTLLLGGLVERTVSDVAGVTVEIACWRLDRDDRPEAPDPATGRILASGGNLDGARLQPGRLVTLVATVVGTGTAASGMLPQVQIRFVYPWPTAAEDAAARQASSCRESCCDPCWREPWHDPWYDPWYCGPYPRWRFGAGYYRQWR